MDMGWGDDYRMIIAWVLDDIGLLSDHYRMVLIQGMEIAAQIGSKFGRFLDVQMMYMLTWFSHSLFQHQFCNVTGFAVQTLNSKISSCQVSQLLVPQCNTTSWRLELIPILPAQNKRGSLCWRWRLASLPLQKIQHFGVLLLWYRKPKRRDGTWSDGARGEWKQFVSKSQIFQV